jgi:hypothetical protein
MADDQRVLVSTIAPLLPFIGYPRTPHALRIVDEGAAP